MMWADASGDDGLVHPTGLFGWQGDGSPRNRPGTPWPRRTEGILPSRISLLRNGTTPMKSGDGRFASKPDVRKAQSFSGRRTLQEANASSRKAPGIHNRLDKARAHPERG